MQRRDDLWRLVLARTSQGRGWAFAVCAVAADRVGVDGAAISLRSHDATQELMASNTRWAAELDELQYTLGEGPGAEAFSSGGPVLVSDLVREDGRWPGFTSTAADMGVGAVFAFPLQTGSLRLGSLDLYRRAPGGLGAEALADAAVLAELATVAVLDEYPRTGTEDAARSGGPDQAAHRSGDSDGERGGVGHYDDVNLAIGILAAQLHLSIADASARLRSHAYSHDLAISAVAHDIIAQRLHLDEPQRPPD